MGGKRIELTLTWRDENYGSVRGATAFRTAVEPFPSETTRTMLARIYRKCGYALNVNRQAWIAEYDDGAPARLAAALDGKGVSVTHRGAVPEALAEEAPPGPRI